MKKTLDIAAIILTVIILLALGAALRGMTAPDAASARFGLPVTDAVGAMFYRVYVSRNIVLLVASAIFLVTQMWRPLAILLSVALTLPVFDMWILNANGQTPPLLHPVTFVVMAAAVALLWRRAIKAGG